MIFLFVLPSIFSVLSFGSSFFGDGSQPPAMALAAFADDHSVRLELTFDHKPPVGYEYRVDIHNEGTGGALIENRLIQSVKTDAEKNRLVFFLDNLKPELWEPQAPVLYSLELKVFEKRRLKNKASIRIGFRSFDSRNGEIRLNHRPIFLRGIAINPPGRGIPRDVERSRQFAEEYVRFMKSINVNIIRIPDDQTWYDVCDELGMMVFGGNYSGLVAGKRPPESVDEAVEWYEEKKFRPIAHHPSLMIYALTNEVPYNGDIARKWEDLLGAVHRKLGEWDSTRLYIGNAGYGYGKSGDICDLHRYWGWYYSSPFTFLHVRNNEDIIPFKKGSQPITFTECVGNYTGPDGRYNLTPDHKNPVSQLCWTGHAPQEMQAQLADEHQAFTLKTATELFRRLRPVNHELSGIFPFTIMFYNWHTARNLVEMGPKPVCRQVRTSYQPILLSWELWTSQVYAGNSIHPIAHIVNDDDGGRDLTGSVLHYGIKDATATYIVQDSVRIPDIKYYQTGNIPLVIQVPEFLPTGRYTLYGRIVNASGVISENESSLFIGNRDFVQSSRVPDHGILLFDPSGKTARSLEELKISFSRVRELNDLRGEGLLVIGRYAGDSINKENTDRLQAFVRSGGRILAFAQDSIGIAKLATITGMSLHPVSMDIDDPVYPPPPRPSTNGLNINPEFPEHVLWSGITREELRVWSDHTGWNETMPGMPGIYPVTDGFILKNKDDMARTSVFANYSVGLEGIALAEFFSGSGSVLVSGFDLVDRTNIDPVADRLLKNMIAYMASGEKHPCHPLITAPIQWGEYETERGLLTGIYSGLMLNSKPKLTGSYAHMKLALRKEGHLFAGGSGGWNSRAGLQYVPYGRRMFGPYVHRGFGGVPEPERDTGNVGEAQFWCRVPDDRHRITNIVWNPADEPLTFSVKVNDAMVAERSVAPGEKLDVTGEFKNTGGAVHVKVSGDRRLVLLETAFE